MPFTPLHRYLPPHSSRTLRAVAVLAFSALASSAMAQIPADSVLREFKINGDFMVVTDGAKMEDAEIFFSQKAVAYLILSPSLESPLLVQVQGRTVESVDASKVIEEADRSRAILADAELIPLGSFTLEAKKQEVLFSLNGKEFALKRPPWLLGKQQGSRLKQHNPEYAFKASEYTPDAADIDTLKSQKRAVKVRIYFGSWCPHCKEMVPRMLRVADEIGDSNIEFEYYGLFSPLGQDGQARTDQIHRVPTAVVYIDGKEVTRGNDLEAPEKTLVKILGLPSSTAAGGSGR